MNLIKQVKWLSVGIASLGLCSPSFALEDESNFYYGISAGAGEVEARGAGTYNEISNGGHLAIGYELLPNLSTELRLHRLSGDVSTNSAYGYLRFSLPVSDHAKPYIMLGAGATDINAKTAAGAAVSLAGIDEPTAGAAIGVNLFGNDETALNLEVSAYASDDILMSFYSIGFQHYFGGHK